MGEVYRALDTRLERSVAIKVLPTHLSDDEALKQRFDREAKTISSLQHPNICALFDVGHENGIDFLVMEYLEGKTLASRLQEGPLPGDDVLRMGVQITEALSAAHRSSVIHRDLKPGNIMLTKAGVKLLDFGLAKTAQRVNPASSITSLATEAAGADPITEKGTILGTFQYMSPEQLEGTDADVRSDIFALGAVLYEMATGKKAFEGKSQASLIAAIMQSQPQPISSIQPMTPPALDRVVRTCLEKDPEDRWQTAHDVALQLKWIEEGGSAAGVPRPVATRRRGRERIAWMVATVAIVAAAALAVIQFMRPAPEPAQSIRFLIDAPPGVTTFGSPRVSPDGRFIAFNGVDSTGTTMLWLRPLGSLQAYALPGTENCGRPFWSPDSKHVAYFSSGKLRRIPVTGGPPLTICEFPRGADGVWGTSAMILFDGATGDSIQVVAAGGGTPKPASKLDRSRGETVHGWPHFLPDGRKFVFIRYSSGQADEIHLGELGSFETTKLTEADSRLEYVEPGYLIFEHNSTLLARPFDADAGQFSGDPFPLAEGIGTGGTGLAHFSGSSNGTLIYTGEDVAEPELVWFDRSGHRLETIGEQARYSRPALSPDGKRAIVAIEDPTSGTDDVWMIDMVRGVTSRFTFDPGDDTAPLWSPDGMRIMFNSDRDEKNAIYSKNASGTGAVEKIVDSSGRSIEAMGWSPDGTVISGHVLAEGTSWDVVTFPTGGGELTSHVSGEFVEAWGNFSPDGRYLAYASNETGRYEIYLMTYPDAAGKWQVSSDGGTEPFWRGDGRELFYISVDRRLMAVDMTPGDPIGIGTPHKLFDAPVPRSLATRNRFVPAADGQRFLLIANLQQEDVSPITVVLNWTSELQDR